MVVIPARNEAAIIGRAVKVCGDRRAPSLLGGWHGDLSRSLTQRLVWLESGAARAVRDLRPRA